ncbi:MAG: hypothetical protein KDJ29_09000 [Hyphomicrobiales bacterium]|nr:hypothetical protein [Hyphomicrobiales bacterium]
MLNKNNGLLGGLFGNLLGGGNRNTQPAAPRRGTYEPNEVGSYIRDALTYAKTLSEDASALQSEAIDLGFKHLQTAEIAAGETSHGFQQRYEDHRLIVNACNYPDALRHMIHVHIPGKLSLDEIGRIRRETGYTGSEGVWEATAYAHWKKKGDGQPQFVDIWIDNFEGRGPALTRMMIEVVQSKQD